MFTGIIQGMGTIQSNHASDQGCVLDINLSALEITNIALGDSVAVNGACLTVVALNQSVARFDVSSESLDKTLIAQWRTGTQVNLEKALNLSTPLGGHLVSGHVDGVGRVHAITPSGDSTEYTFWLPAALARFVATKGSVCINGVSLTSNAVLADAPDGSLFSVMIVPHTLQVTSLSQLTAGSEVHLEIDLIARYLERLRTYPAFAND